MKNLLVVLSVALVVLNQGCGDKDERPVVVSTTANIAAIVKAVAGDRVRNITLAPAGMCPGHFDIRPSHVAAAAGADLLIRQGWEVWFDDLERALPSAPARTVTAATQGNWMLPEVHRKAVAEITGLLSELDTAWADTFRLRADRYLARLDSTAKEARALIAAARTRFPDENLPVAMAAEHQAPLMRWLGFRVAATYGRPEEFTASELTRLAKVGTDSSVGIVVDNLQSGPDAGRPLADALGARQVNLSNFPLDDDYPATLVDNARKVTRLFE